MNKNDSTLVEILGATDAIFRPVREVRSPRWAAAHVARREFETTGVQWRPGASTESGRRGSARSLESLAEAGLVTVFKAAGMKLPCVKLTDPGERRARSLAGLPSVQAGVESLRRLIKLSTRAGSSAGQCGEPVGLVGELAMTGAKAWDQDEVAVVLQMLAPAFVRGWAVWQVNSRRNVWYQATDLGREAVATWTNEAETTPDRKATQCQPLRAVWGRAMGEMIDRLNDQMVVQEIGEPPVSASILTMRHVGAKR